MATAAGSNFTTGTFARRAVDRRIRSAAVLGGILMSTHATRLAPGLIAPLLPARSATARPGDVALHGAALDVLGTGMFTLQVVDLDGDGLADLLGSGQLLGVWRNVGGGRLTPLPSLPPLIDGGAVRAIDLDGDGVMSLVAFGLSDVHAKEFVAPFVPGPDQAVAPFGIGIGFAFNIQDADLDGDGLPDVVSPGLSGILSSLNDGSGGLKPGVPSAGIPTARFALGDIDLDGRIDLVAIADAPVYGQSILTAALGQGDGTFVPQPSIPLTGFAKDIALGHVDGDGLLDVAVAAIGGTQLLIGTGSGGFAPFAQDAESSFQIALADADGDGDDDVLSATWPLGPVHTSLMSATGLSPQPGFAVGLP